MVQVATLEAISAQFLAADAACDLTSMIRVLALHRADSSPVLPTSSGILDRELVLWCFRVPDLFLSQSPTQSGDV